ncbi:hypothetical protein [Methylobacterium oryzisoli]
MMDIRKGTRIADAAMVSGVQSFAWSGGSAAGRATRTFTGS